MPSSSALLVVKIGIVALSVVGVFVLAALGRIDASIAIGSIVVLVHGLCTALGLASTASAQFACIRMAIAERDSVAEETRKAPGVGLPPMPLLILAACAALCCSCIAQPAMSQQIATFQATELCVEEHWGEALDLLAGDCLGGIVSAAEDVAADIEAIAEGAAVLSGKSPDLLAAAFPYAGNTRVVELVRVKRQRLIAKGAPR